MEENRSNRFFIIVVPVFIIVAFISGWFFSKEISQENQYKNNIKSENVTQKELREGVYSLVGKNPSNNEVTYQGTVEIVRTGNIYDLVWRISEKQTQRGVGIMNGNILSVGYIDITDREIKDAGAVSYFVVSDEIMDGAWVSTLGGMTGEEHLTWLRPLESPSDE